MNENMKLIVVCLVGILIGGGIVFFLQDKKEDTPVTIPQRQTLLDSIVLDVKEMTCDACAHKLSEAINKLPGVRSCQVDYLTRKAHCMFDSNKIVVKRLIQAVSDVGFDATISRVGEPSSGKSSSKGELKVLDYKLKFN